MTIVVPFADMNDFDFTLTLDLERRELFFLCCVVFGFLTLVHRDVVDAGNGDAVLATALLASKHVVSRIGVTTIAGLFFVTVVLQDLKKIKQLTSKVSFCLLLVESPLINVLFVLFTIKY